MLVAKSELAFRSHARRLNEPAFTEVSGLTNGCRERLVGRIADFATSINSDAGGEVSGPASIPFSASTGRAKILGGSRLSERPA